MGAVGLTLLLAVLWTEHRSDITLPAPTGSFAVGRVIYDWTDDAHTDPLAPVPGTKRELLVWIWYPSAPAQSAAIADYLPAPMRAAAEAGGPLSLLTRDLAKVHTHSARDSPVSPQQPSYPVVIMRTGASAEVWNYSTLAEDLASHGYVVVGFDAPYRTFAVTFPDGRVIRRTPANNPEFCVGQPPAQQTACAIRILNAWTSDTAFVLDRLSSLNASDSSGKFTGRLDMTRVGMFGHSFGGAASVLFCHDDSRCKAGIDLDGAVFGSVIQEGLHQPFLFVLSDQSHATDPQSRRFQADIQSIYDRLPPNGRLRVAIRGANHFFFGENNALLKSPLVLRLLRMLRIVDIDGRRQLAITTYCLRTFFDAYLKRAGAEPLNISSPLYPEIQVLE